VHHETTFLAIAKKVGTDKVDKHNYDVMYTKYFEHLRFRHRVKKLLEIGLGCTMDYGPGASAKLWREYMPHAELWMAEFNAGCVQRHESSLREMNVHVVTGDQADTATLNNWTHITGGNFDVIVDDGGHTNMQQYSSFVTLFIHALAPGGVYFLEDIVCSRGWVDGDGKHVMIEVIKDWIEGLVMGEKGTRPDPAPGYEYTPKFGLPPGVKSIDCFSGVCAFTKCKNEDKRCESDYFDESLINYENTGTGLGPATSNNQIW
jgi:hypothetical protein